MHRVLRYMHLAIAVKAKMQVHIPLRYSGLTNRRTYRWIQSLFGVSIEIGRPSSIHFECIGVAPPRLVTPQSNANGLLVEYNNVSQLNKSYGLFANFHNFSPFAQ